ncbi:MAG TPA: POTRA domain-containing protein [Fimbriimonas sp.]|nr:POTRA domain-containing protein [Fimbriimonas sp.]
MSIRIWTVFLLFTLSVWVAAQQQSSSVISEILVRGNQRVLKEVILAQMRTKVGQPYIQETLEKDEQAIYDLGFFTAVDVRPTPLEGGNYRVTVDVAEYAEIKEIRIVGNSAVKTEEIMAVLTIKPGQVFNLKARQESTNAIRDLYSKKGFLLAGINEFGPLAESPGTINIDLVETKVSSVSVQGNTRTKDWVMKRLIKTRAGDTFNLTKWANDLRRLYNTQWFETVNSVEDTGKELGKIDLTAEVKEMKTGMFNVGLQLDPRSSFAGVIRLSEANLRGSGQSVGLNFIQATRGGGPSLDLDYTNPFFDEKDTTMRVALYSRLVYRFSNAFGTSSGITSTDDFNERRTGGSIGFSRPVTDYFSLGLSFRYEGVKTNNIGSATGDFIQQDGTVGVISLGGILNRRDVDVDPSRGDWLRLDLEPGFANISKVGGALATQKQYEGRKSFLKTNFEYRRYWSPDPPRGRDLDAPRKVVAARIKLGNIAGTSPFFEQFFVGGSDSLRGYDEDRFWGNNAFIATLEYRHPVQKSFNVIGFVDYGGAWGGYGSVNNFTQSASPNFHVGYGVGLSFRTPLGPIRLDLGFDDRGKSRTHFLIGTSF